MERVGSTNGVAVESIDGVAVESIDGVAGALELIHQMVFGDALCNAPILAFVANENMRYVAVSNGACEALGYSRQELLALRVADIATEPSAAADYADMIATGSQARTTKLRTSSGDSLAFSYFASETLVAGVPFYLALGVVS